ncbi:uracil-DNA glycosylase [Planctomycetota bacterium]
MEPDIPDSLAQEVKLLVQGIRGELELLQKYGISTLPISITKLSGEIGGSGPNMSLPSSGERDPGGGRLKTELLQRLEQEAEACRKCEIASQRNKVVFGSGNINADLVFVGEAPGREEDAQGLPFVGRAGKLLDKMIDYLGMVREQVYILNTLKCRPPGNRNPAPQEMENCKSFFNAQLQIIKPKVIIALGAFATQRLLQSDLGIGRLRGKFQEYDGIPVMPTYHPAYLLRNNRDENRQRVKSDLRQVGEKYFNITRFNP